MNVNIKVKDNFIKDFINKDTVKTYTKKAEDAYNMLINGTGQGNDFLGWVDLPQNYDKFEYERIKAAAKKIKSNSELFIVVGIGGSYLGARAAIEFLHSPLYNNLKKETPDIYFIGNSLSSDSLDEICSLCNGRDFSINVISKSGTTTEPAIAFRVLRKMLEDKYGKDGARERIFITTDKNAEKSNLKKLADKNGYETFIVPDNVGGRYSVLTAVGLLPITVSGANTDEIMLGAQNMRNKCKLKFDADTDAVKYAILRNVLHDSGNAKSVEILTCYEPSFQMMNEWWKQLYGESEGKDKRGIYPASTIFSTDLHSLGQFIQDGARIIFETVVNIIKPNKDIIIPADSDNTDGMDYIDNVKLSSINNKAYLGTILAHTDGGTPNIIIDIADKTEKTFGELVYFFEFACALSGYILGVNPFNQPGVEEYKKNMFALIDKPTDELKKRKSEIMSRLEKPEN